MRWTDTDGALAETDTVLFHPQKRTLEAPKVVHFTRGTVDLTAPSASYDLHQKVVHFSGPVEGASGGAETGGLTHLTAKEGLYRRDAGVPRARAGDRRLPHGRPPRGGTPRPQAGNGTGSGNGGGNRPEWAQATGGVRGSLLPGGVGDGATAAHGNRKYEGDESLTTFDENGRAKAVTLRGAPARLSDDQRRVTALADPRRSDGGPRQRGAGAGQRRRSSRRDGPRDRSAGGSPSRRTGPHRTSSSTVRSGSTRTAAPPRRLARSRWRPATCGS